MIFIIWHVISLFFWKKNTEDTDETTQSSYLEAACRKEPWGSLSSFIRNAVWEQNVPAAFLYNAVNTDCSANLIVLSCWVTAVWESLCYYTWRFLWSSLRINITQHFRDRTNEFTRCLTHQREQFAHLLIDCPSATTAAHCMYMVLWQPPRHISQ